MTKLDALTVDGSKRASDRLDAAENFLTLAAGQVTGDAIEKDILKIIDRINDLYNGNEAKRRENNDEKK